MQEWPDPGKILIIIGLVLAAVGLLVLLRDKLPFTPGRLPGDILIKRENFTFYFPLGTCILISAVLTLIFFLWRK
ncbi:conserved hypothetical protein [Desulfonatronospira thiodismutans ASO3-1]|uniref:DUF2905 domain-containing protein n=1 Tax=Desulfonatronospira thiodismutans ASO3-1 TaxID=555779 RepID=D6SLR3_9BACT|nr:MULTISPECIES: DUF2905 domain-containing protein [Desulfonatronospira]EFI35624.1 conserved hypothetical protein [Desulfonatronospira thiodismutans ASO3-1]RQD78493.1 MAG: DUF2905 domain-containing protein [Desulfonatronospira sp. MSAO_Bac3]